MKKLSVLALTLCLLVMPVLAGSEGIIGIEETMPTDMQGEELEFALEGGGAPDESETLSLLELTGEAEQPSEGGIGEINLAASDAGAEAVKNDGNIPIDETHFPDAAFRDYISKFDYTYGVRDGMLSAEEIESVTKISCSEKGIASLVGIEYFPNLTSLVCSGNSLTALDVSRCENLVELQCQGNLLTSLDVSKCENLKWIKCSHNQLTELDVSKCQNLKSLECCQNQLTKLDVSGCHYLESLSCQENQLTGLGLSTCAGLTSLECSNNQLTELNLSGCPVLEKLYCDHNRLTSLVVRNLGKLWAFYCQCNLLTELDLTGCESLKYFSCNNNDLAYLDVSGCPIMINCINKGDRKSGQDAEGDPDYEAYFLMVRLRDGAWANVAHIKYDKRIHSRVFLDASEVPQTPTLVGGEQILYVGETIEILDSSTIYRAKECDFQTSNAAVVSVDAAGVIKGIGEGVATITATSKKTGKSAACEVKVPTPPESITLTPNKLILVVGEHFPRKYFLYKISPEGAESTFEWTSSDESVVSMTGEEGNGDLIANTIGVAKIRYKSLNGKEGICEVTVGKNPSRVILKSGGGELKNVIDIYVGDTLAVAASTPKGTGTSTPYKWDNSNRHVVGMSTDGWKEGPSWEMNADCELTGIRAGTADIRVCAMSRDGQELCWQVAASTVKVRVHSKPTKVELEGDVQTWECRVGDKHTCKAKVTPYDDFNSLNWKSSNEKVATVSKKGVVTAVGKGNATITVSTFNGKKAKMKVKVSNWPSSVTLNMSNATMGVGDELSLAATKPKGSRAALKWSSSDTNVATVSQGVVKAVGKGSATISVKAGSGKAATCKITVKAHSTKIKLSEKKRELKIGASFTLKATLEPAKSAAVVRWTSSDTSVASVDADSGKVTALKVGTATIKARASGCESRTCTVTVIDANPVKYRALLISMPDKDNGVAYKKDVEMMRNMLNHVKGAESGADFKIYPYPSTLNTIGGVHSAIQKAFGGADDNDISLFFITTHGKEGEGYEKGALKVRDDAYLPLPKLAGWLNAVPGRVVVMICSCQSGTAVQNGSTSGGIEEAQKAARDFNTAAINAFAEIDNGIYVDERGNGVSEAEAIANAGEFRIADKFYVLTASEPDKVGKVMCGPDDYYSFFVKWITDGVGNSGKMPADKAGDKNGVLTLRELYNYLIKRGKEGIKIYKEEVYYQYARVYPDDSRFPLFKR